MPKHSFNADAEAETILGLVERVIRDKTEFLNRLIVLHGRPTIEHIMHERQRALHESQAAAIHEPAPPYRSKPPSKTQGRVIMGVRFGNGGPAASDTRPQSSRRRPRRPLMP